MKLTDILINEAPGNRENQKFYNERSSAPLGRYVKSDKAAEYLGVTPSRIRQLVKSGELKSYSKEGEELVLKFSQVKSFAVKEKSKKADKDAPGAKSEKPRTEKE